MIKTSKTSQNQLLSSCRSYNELHMLYSMLPKQYSMHSKQQFKKTKDFFRPGQCIWNNPHRTSDRLYKYYHKGIDYYKQVKQPQIDQKQSQARQAKQMNRIIQLSKKRHQVRNKFHSKKLQRLQLENKTGIRRDQSSRLVNIDSLATINTDKQAKLFSQTIQQPLILKRSNSQSLRIPSTNNMKINYLYKKMKTKGQQPSLNEKSYLSSVSNFDMKNKTTAQILKRSQKQMKDNIRQNFTRQKENNLMNLSKNTFLQSKLLKSTLSKKSPSRLDFSNQLKTRVTTNIQHYRS